MLEFIDLEHTPKNIMIRASLRPGGAKAAAARKKALLPEIEAALKEFQVEPTLYRLLRERVIGEDNT